MEAALLNTCSGEVEHFLDNGEVKGFGRLESGEKTKIGPNSEANSCRCNTFHSNN